tara:strand:+ start:2852 stop:4675 length:1824 start_codon:yes stop_codon:yes gene_type:complete
MFQTAPGDTGEGKSIKGAFDKFKGQFKNLTQELLNFDTQAKKVISDTFGQGVGYADAIRQSLALSVSKTAELGYTTEQYATLLSSVSTSLQTNTDFTSEQLSNMMLFADAAGISAEEVGKLVTGFSNIGVGTTQSLKDMQGLTKTARSYGVNVSQYMGVIAENLHLMNSFKFQGGVQGLGKMVAKSQALRIDLSTVTTLAEKFLDPAGAIDAAASLQMMGGQLAQLGDGFNLMNLAQNDVEGLFDSIVEATAASVSFNEQSGSFELSALEMRRLRATAKDLGVDYGKLTKGAINFAERQEKISQLDFMGGIAEEDKEFFASVGQLDKGELKFNVKREDEDGKMVDKLVALNDLLDENGKMNEKDRERFEKMQLDSKISDKEIAIQQRDILTKLYNAATETGLKVTSEEASQLTSRDGSGNINNTNAYSRLEDGLNDVSDTLTNTLDMIITSNALQKSNELLFEAIDKGVKVYTSVSSTLTSVLNDKLGDLFKGTINDGVVQDGNIVTTHPDDYLIATKDPAGMVDNILSGLLPKEIGSTLQDNNSPSVSPKISFEDLQITHSGSIKLEGDGRFITLDTLASNPQMLENLTNMIKRKMSDETMGYSNA